MRSLAGSVFVHRSVISPKTVFAGLLAAVLGGFLGIRLLIACMGTPSPPTWGATVVYGKSVPGVIIASPAAPTLFTMPSLVYIGQTEFPPGVGICPAVTDLTITLNITCTPGPSPAQVVFSATNPALGFNTVNVPITFAPGPPRFCAVSGTATVTYADGSTLSNTGDQEICLVEPSPGDPDTPRLDLQLLDPADALTRVHPSDQDSTRYVLTNNDPKESWTGMIGVQHGSVSGIPTATGPLAAGDGSGPYSPSSPGGGDHFPIAFEDLLPPAPADCVPFGDTPPHLVNVREIDRPITLGPGESFGFDLAVRPYPGCANGSCGETRVVTDGTFTDQSDGFACAGTVTAVDFSQPPQYAWPDSGAGIFINSDPLRPFDIILECNPTPTLNYDFFVGSILDFILVDGQPVQIAPPEGLPGRTDPHRGRQATTIQGANPGQVLMTTDQVFQTGIRTFLQPVSFLGPIDQFTLEGFQSVDDVDISVQPFFIGTLRIEDFDADPTGPDGETFLDLHFQRSFVGLTDTDDLVFAHPVAPSTIGDIFTDGFESGDVMAWSTTVPESQSESPGPPTGAQNIVSITIFNDVTGFARSGEFLPPTPTPTPTPGPESAARHWRMIRE